MFALSSVFLELGINPENSTKASEPSSETKLLIEAYSREMMFIARLFTRFLPDWRPKNLRKIAISIVDSPKNESTSSAVWLTKVCILYRYFDWIFFDKEQNQIARYKILLDFMLDTLVEASKQFDWPTEVFTEAYSKVMASNFINKYYLLSAKSSPDKKQTASVSVHVDRDHSTIFLEVRDKGEKVQETEIIKVAQHKDDFIDITESIRWIDNSEIMVSNKESEIHFKYSLLNQTIETILAPKVHNEKYLLDELKLIDPSTSKAERLDIINKRIADMKSNSRYKNLTSSGFFL